ncbi:MAG: hypothetical protein IPK60_01285 [Sandaracinaceae bacterium]|nr:hypothetical protein [Sandaracinaceae bacterium]
MNILFRLAVALFTIAAIHASPAVAHDVAALMCEGATPMYDATTLQRGSCGDGQCAAPEDCNTCPRDCGQCCGDRRCAPPEDCNSCSRDCGPCR